MAETHTIAEKEPDIRGVQQRWNAGLGHNSAVQCGACHYCDPGRAVEGGSNELDWSWEDIRD